jgi:hypothetical protein
MLKVRTLLVLAACAVLLLAIVPASAQTLKTAGYLQAWYLSQQNDGLAGDPSVENGVAGFRIRRARLNVHADMNEVFSLDTWLEFAGSSNVLLDYKGSAKIAPEFVVSVGQYIPPATMNETANIASSKILFYEISDIALNLANIMGTESYRDIGLTIGGQYDVVKYGLYYGNGRGRFNAAGSGQSILNRKMGQGLWGLRIDAEPVKGFLVGGHFSLNKQDSINTGTATAPAISSLNRTSFSLNAGTDGLGLEQLFVQIEYGNGKVNDLTKLVTAYDNGKQTYTYNGFYATLGYKVLPTFHLLFRYDTFSQTKLAAGALPEVTTKANNMTFGATVFFVKEKTEFCKVGVNYEVRKEDPTDARNNAFVIWTQFRM